MHIRKSSLLLDNRSSGTDCQGSWTGSDFNTFVRRRQPTPGRYQNSNPAAHYDLICTSVSRAAVTHTLTDTSVIDLPFTVSSPHPGLVLVIPLLTVSSIDDERYCGHVRILLDMPDPP